MMESQYGTLATICVYEWELILSLKYKNRDLCLVIKYLLIENNALKVFLGIQTKE